jgi:magnesium transporter
VTESLQSITSEQLQQLKTAVMRRAPLDALALLEGHSNEVVAATLEALKPDLAVRILSHMDEKRAEILSPLIQQEVGEQWSVNLSYAEKSIGRIMEPPTDAFPGSMTVNELIEALRDTASERQIVYAFITDIGGVLKGLVVLRDLLFADQQDSLESLMITDPFYFRAATTIDDAMQPALLRHYPIYPVCDANRKLVGQIRGYALFERQNIELTAHTGQMVGVEREEHIHTP